MIGDVQEGLLVVHPKRPEWGLGRVLVSQGTRLTVYFRDIPGDHPEDAVRTLDTRFVSLTRAATQSDCFLNNLPPYREGKFQRATMKRVTLQEGLDKFQSHCPLYFKDPAYIGDMKSGERFYKWAAHELFVATLGNGQLERLLREQSLEEARSRALAVEGRLNLLAVFEKAALRDGLRDRDAATRYFDALSDILESPSIDRASFERYLRAVESFPAAPGKTPPAKWTITTVLPYVAQPDRFMFLKPEVTQDCAARLTFDLEYSPHPNWLTYSRLLEMSASLLEQLRPYGAQDFIDVQSFIWLVGGGWDN